MNKVVEHMYKEHGQDALFKIIDLYTKDIEHFVVYRSKAWTQKWPDFIEEKRKLTLQPDNRLILDLMCKVVHTCETVVKKALVEEDGIQVSYNIYHWRRGRYAGSRFEREDAILDRGDLEAKEDYIQQESKKVKAEVEIEQATTIPKNILRFHHLCYRMIKFVLRMPRTPPNLEKMNVLIDSLYLEFGSDSIFTIDDWYASSIREFEVYDSKAHTQTFISRDNCRKRLVWMQKLNWIRRLQDLRRGNEVTIDVSILNEESIPVDWTCRVFVRGRYMVCTHCKKKQMPVAESCVINMDTEFYELQREVDEFEALEQGQSNDYHYGLKLGFKTLKILMGLKREPPSPSHLKIFANTQYTQYGTKAMFSVMDWHADCLDNFISYTSDELSRRFDKGTDTLEHVQWSEKINMRQMLRELRAGKMGSFKMILLDNDNMQSHVRIECIKMGRYSINLFREINKHSPRPLQELEEVQNEPKPAWNLNVQTVVLVIIAVVLVIIAVCLMVLILR